MATKAADKASEKAVVVKNTESKVIHLYPEQLEVRKGFNVRFDMGDLTEMGKTIVQGGIRTPLRGYKTGEKTDDGWPIYAITDGHRRYAAAVRVADKMDAADFIPFQCEPAGYTDQQRTIDMLVTGETSKNHNLLETAKGVQRLMHPVEDGVEALTQAQVAKAIGKSPMYVSDCVLLMTKATEKMIKQIETGQISASTVVETLKAADTQKAAKAIDKAIDKADDKAGGKGKGKVKASQIKEESGEAMTAKGKKAELAKKATKKETEPKPEKEAKMDGTLTKLVDFRTALKAQDGTQNKEAFGILNALIKLGKGTAAPIDLISLFFVEEEAAAEEETPKKKKVVIEKEVPAVKKAAGKKKKSDDDDDAEPSAKDIKNSKISLDDADDDDLDESIE